MRQYYARFIDLIFTLKSLKRHIIKCVLDRFIIKFAFVINACTFKVSLINICVFSDFLFDLDGRQEYQQRINCKNVLKL